MSAKASIKSGQANQLFYYDVLTPIFRNILFLGLLSLSSFASADNKSQPINCEGAKGLPMSQSELTNIVALTEKTGQPVCDQTNLLSILSIPACADRNRPTRPGEIRPDISQYCGDESIDKSDIILNLSEDIEVPANTKSIAISRWRETRTIPDGTIYFPNFVNCSLELKEDATFIRVIKSRAISAQRLWKVISEGMSVGGDAAPVSVVVSLDDPTVAALKCEITYRLFIHLNFGDLAAFLSDNSLGVHLRHPECG